MSVGSLEELSEVEHDWISFLNGEGSNHGRPACGPRLCAVEPRSGPISPGAWLPTAHNRKEDIKRRAGLETRTAEADPPLKRGRLPAVGKRATRAPTGSAGVLAVVEEGIGRNTGSPAGGAAHANRQPARVRSGRQGGGEVRRYRGSRVMPAEGRDLRWKRWRRQQARGSGRRPSTPQTSRNAGRHHMHSEGDDPRGRGRQGVDRPDDAPAGPAHGCELGATTRETHALAVAGNPCASRMIPLESPVPAIGTPGSESGGRKRAYGLRTAARPRKRRTSHRALPVTRLPSTLHESGRYPLACITTRMVSVP